MDTKNSASGIGPAPGKTGVRIPMDEENKQQLAASRQDQRRQRMVGDKLSRFLTRISDDIESLDREKRLKLFRTQIKAHKYLDGNFYGYVDENCEWRDVQRQEGEVWYSDNQLYPYWRSALMELSRTQTEVVVNANSLDEKMENVAKFAKSRYDANRSRTFSVKLKQTENAYALLNGITYRYTFPQFDTKGKRQERVPKVTERPGEDAGTKGSFCAVCSRPAPSEADTMDVKDILGAEYIDKRKCVCGSEMFTEAAESDPSVVIGYEDVPRCENAWIVPNPVSVIVSMQASDIRETPYIKWKQQIIRSVLEEKFKGIPLPSTGTPSVELRYISNQLAATPGEGTDNLEFGSGNTGDAADSQNELEILEFHQIWLDYAVYCKKKFDVDMPISNSKVLKAGQPLGSMFPNGLYYAKVGDLILDMWDEDKNKKWSSSPYGMRPGSMYGTGSAVALSDQETINDIERLKMSNAWANGVPLQFVDPTIIPELSADPNIPTKFVGEAGMKDVIGRGYQQAPATSLSAEVYKIKEERAASIQNKIGAMSGTGAGGLADTQKWGDTATAISIKRDLAVGRFSPDLELMADQLDREQAYQFLENEQEFFTPAQWDELKGAYSDEVLQLYLKSDIRRDFNISIAAGSFMPKSDAQVQSKLMSLVQILPALAQSQNPELLAYAFEVFGMPTNLGGWNTDRGQADRVVGRFSALCQQFIGEYGDAPTSDLNDPKVLEAVTLVTQHANIPVDIFLDNHDALAEAYRDQRATDEGREWPNLLTACVAKRVLEHRTGTVLQEQMMGRMAQEAMQPLKEEAEAEQQKLLEAQNAQVEQERAATEEIQQAEMLNKAVEYNDKDESRRVDLEKQAAQHEHEKELKAVELLAAQAKPEPGKK